jgi:hypothetical protein
MYDNIYGEVRFCPRCGSRLLGGNCPTCHWSKWPQMPQFRFRQVNVPCPMCGGSGFQRTVRMW